MVLQRLIGMSILKPPSSLSSDSKPVPLMKHRVLELTNAEDAIACNSRALADKETLRASKEHREAEGAYVSAVTFAANIITSFK